MPDSFFLFSAIRFKFPSFATESTRLNRVIYGYINELPFFLKFALRTLYEIQIKTPLYLNLLNYYDGDCK